MAGELTLADFDHWAHCLALMESRDHEQSWGDPTTHLSGYQADGRWQMHPSFVWEFGPETVGLHESWDVVFAITLKAFYGQLFREFDQPWELANAFHLGVTAARRGDVDTVYRERFESYYSQAGPGSA